MTATHARTGALTVSACVLGLACSGTSTPPPHGAPVLTHVYWIAGGTSQLVYARESDTRLATSVPPLATEVDFVFDRRLDGERIEDTVTVDGAVTTVPKTTMPPVEAHWPDMPLRSGQPPFELSVVYNSAARYGGESSYVFARPALPGFPSGETIKFALHADQLTNAYGEAADLGLSEIPVKTAPFTALVNAPTASVSARFQLPLVFSNRLPPLAHEGPSPFIHVTARGAEVPYKLLADASVVSRWYLAPADCLGAWLANATLSVTVDMGLSDAFGVPLEAPATGTFRTGAPGGASSAASSAASPAASPAAPSDAASEASCPFDGGSPEDGGADGDASDGGAPDDGNAVGDGGGGDAGDAATETS